MPKKINKGLITDDETKILAHITEAWNIFLIMPVIHSDDNDDFRYHIHRLQDIILSRATLRMINDHHA